MIRVLVVDDHALVREGLERLLNGFEDLEVVGTAVDGAAALVLAEARRPDVVLMDLSMPGMDGAEATRRLSAAHPEIKVVVLTSFSDHRRILDVLGAGAAGFVLKDAEPAELAAAIRTVMAGGAPLDPKAARALLDAQRLRSSAVTVSPREREVLELLMTGLANKQIARRLNITERTVKAHLTSIYQSLGVDGRTQAVLWAKEHLPEL
jgi:DNA-binding NarL/FixJ family response regulator